MFSSPNEMRQVKDLRMEDIDNNIQKIINLSLREPLKLITIKNTKKIIHIKECLLLCSKYN